MLQALEEDKFGQLPGGIFNKGFVRAYARCVGIDEEQAVSDYLIAAGEPAPTSAETGVETGAGPSPNKGTIREVPAVETQPSSRQIPWGLFAALLLLVALALSVWTHRKRETTQLPAPVPTSSASPPSSSSDAAAAGIADNKKLETPISPVLPDHSAAVLATKENSTRKFEPTSGSTAITPSGGQSGEFTVVVQGREDCWISITSDGKTIASYLLPGGEQRVARGRQSVIIKAGNAGGLDLLFNGKKVALQGTSGEVKTLIFGPEGLEASSTAPPNAQ